MKFVKYGLDVVVLALVAMIFVSTMAAGVHGAEPPDWQHWQVDQEQMNGSTTTHHWKSINSHGAVHVLYKLDGKFEHAITISHYNEKPYVRWTELFTRHAERPPWPRLDVLRYYYLIE